MTSDDTARTESSDRAIRSVNQQVEQALRHKSLELPLLTAALTALLIWVGAIYLLWRV